MFHGNANKYKLKLHLTPSRMTIVKMKKKSWQTYRIHSVGENIN